MKFVPGCCNCVAPTFTGIVKGCSSIATDIGVQSVTIKDGATTIWTGSTNANGTYTGTGTLPSTVTVEVDAGDRFAAFSGSASVSGTTSKTIAPVTLAPVSGFICLDCCALPIASTLFQDHTDGGDTNLPLVYSTSPFGDVRWWGQDSASNIYSFETNCKYRINGTAEQAAHLTITCSPFLLNDFNIFHVTE